MRPATRSGDIYVAYHWLGGAGPKSQLRKIRNDGSEKAGPEDHGYRTSLERFVPASHSSRLK